MDYFFPSLLTEVIKRTEKVANDDSINNGENAIRLLLEMNNLPNGALVAIPAFVCTSVKNAVCSSGHIPLELDLLPDSFETDYGLIESENVKAVILVHLYGQVHSQTKWVQEVCNMKKIFLIHDLAQSYGVDVSIFDKSPRLYSFGPGKSSTAAGGAIIENSNLNLNEKIKSPRKPLLINLYARRFVKNRIYGYNFTLLDKFESLIFGRIIDRTKVKCNYFFEKMTAYQITVANYVMKRVPMIINERQKRHSIISNGLINSTKLKILNKTNDGLCFKCVLLVDQADKFINYLNKNKIPFYQLYSDLNKDNNSLPNFKHLAPCIFEFSTEVTVTVDEIKRIASLLAHY